MPDQNITERRSGYFLNAGTNQKHWCYVKLIREIKRGRVSSKYKKKDWLMHYTTIAVKKDSQKEC